MTKEKVAIITAGGSGMGAATAKRLAQDGYKIAILSSSGKGAALAKELGGLGVTGSNQSNDDLKRLVDETVALWGRIDVLVNSAGHGPRAPVLELTDEDWHKGIEEFRARIPMERYGKAEEIAGTIAFLASDDAGYITGQNLRVDGGITRSV